MRDYVNNLHTAMLYLLVVYSAGQKENELRQLNKISERRRKTRVVPDVVPHH